MERGDRGAELGHRVEGGREVVEHVFDVLWDGCTGGKLLGHGSSLVWGWNLAGEEEPDYAFWEHLGAAWCRRELILALEQGEASVPDAFVRVQDRGLGDHALDASHTTVRLVDGDFSEDLGAVLGSEGCDLFLVDRDEFGEPFLQAAWLPRGEEEGEIKMNEGKNKIMLETIPLIVFRGPKDEESNVCVCVCFAEKKLQYRCNARLNTAGMRLLGRGGRTNRLSERKIATMGGRVFYLMPSVEN